MEDHAPKKGEGSDHDSMKTLTSCTNKLNGEGYSAQFKALKGGLESLDSKKIYQPDEVRIASFYRFEGESDPSDNAILYAIETSEGERGTLVDSYGAEADTKVSEFIQAVENIHKTAPGEAKDESNIPD